MKKCPDFVKEAWALFMHQQRSPRQPSADITRPAGPEPGPERLQQPGPERQQPERRSWPGPERRRSEPERSKWQPEPAHSRWRPGPRSSEPERSSRCRGACGNDASSHEPAHSMTVPERSSWGPERHRPVPEHSSSHHDDDGRRQPTNQQPRPPSQRRRTQRNEPFQISSNDYHPRTVLSRMTIAAPPI